MRHLFQLARKDPQKTAGISVLATLALGALVLYIVYLRTPPATQPQTLSIYPPKPATRPTTRRTELLDDTRAVRRKMARRNPFRTRCLPRTFPRPLPSPRRAYPR